MTSRLIVNSIRHTGASADAITLDNSGNITCNGVATGFADNNVINDISALALKINALQNATRYNTNSISVETFQDSNGVASFTNSSRDSTGEYVSSTSESYGTDQFWGTSDLDSSRVTDHFNSGFSASGLINGSTSSYASYRNDPNNFDTGVGYQVGQDSDFGVGFKITGFRFFNFQTESRYKHFKYVVNDNQVDSSPEDNSARYGSSSYILTAGNANAWTGGTLDTPVVASSSTEIKVLFDEHYENVSGNPNAGIAEIELKGQKLTTSFSATGSFISNAVTASASTTKMGVVITYKDHVGTATLNTDLKVSVSANNGSNFTQGTLVAQPNFATGVKMAKVNDVTVTAGTQLKYKVEFANQASGSKETRVTGVSMQF